MGSRELAGAYPAFKNIVMNTTSQANLTEIYDEYHTPIYRYIYRQVSDVETARDLTADVFQRLLQNVRRNSQPVNHLPAWYTGRHTTWSSIFTGASSTASINLSRSTYLIPRATRLMPPSS